MYAFFVLGIVTVVITVALFGCSAGKSNKSTTTTRKSTSNPKAKKNDQPTSAAPKPTSIPPNPPKPSADKLPPSRPSESGGDKPPAPSKKPIVITGTPEKPPGKMVVPKDRTNTYLDETQQSRLSASEVDKDGKRKIPSPETAVDGNRTEDKQLSKTPATEAKTIDVVPATKVKVLGELDKAILQKRAQMLKEIEEMGSVHEFDKPQCRHSVEKAEPIDPNKHVVVAEDKFKLYIISSDEVLEEQPTQKSVV
uniref:Extensin-like n=1 Tax=Panagrellus redivivus TaxID=6233 RepID=A0A7E4UR05_PANRE